VHWENLKHIRTFWRLIRPKPKVLYKYHTVNSYLYEILEKNRFWAGSAVNLNDPYDCSFEISKNFFRTKYLDRITPQEIGLQSSGTEENKKAWDYLASALDDRFLGEFQKFYRSNTGVCCFSENPTSELMWSHYANSGKGVCLGFSFKTNPTLEKRLVAINYSNDPINVNNDIDRFKALFQKRIAWSYEKEWRMLDDVGHIQFNKPDLVSITFGPTTTQEDITSITELSLKNGYKTIFQVCDYQKSGLKLRLL
jgi:hypothetical protein